MAIEKVIDIKIESNADERVGSLRSQLKEAQADVAILSEKFGVTSVEATNAAKKAAELKDQIGDAKALTDAFNPDAKFKALTSSLAGVAGGFGALQGGMALFGAESEEVEKTLLKVQSAMALSQGLQAIGESIDSFNQLGAVIQNTTKFQKLNSIATAGAAIVQKLFTGAVDTTATSFKLLKGALISTGIGALVVGLGYLISKMNESADAAEELTLQQESLNKQLEITKKLTDDAAKAIDYNTQIQLANAKKRGASEKELLRIQLDGYEEKGKANNKEIEDIQRTQKNGYNLTKEQNKRIEDLRQQNIDLQRQGNVAIANLDADLANKQRETSKKAGEDSKSNSKKNREELEAQRKKDAENLKAALDAQKNAEIEQRNEITKAIGEAQDKQTEKNLTASEVEQRAIKDKYFGLIELAKQQNRSKEEIDALEIQRLNELNEIKDKYRLQDDQKKATELEKQINDNTASFELRLQAIDTEQALFKKQLDDKVITEEQYNEKTKGLAKSREEIAKAEAKAKMDSLDSYGNALGSIAGMLGESTTAGKAAAVASATISTYSAANKAYESQLAIPTPDAPIRATIAAGIAIAGGLLNVQKILAVKTPGGGGSGGTAPSGGNSMTAPSFNVVGSSSTNQLAQSIGTQSQTPVRSYVVASDVSTAQALDRNIIRNATIGG
jgi:myosin heavy subunit